MALSVSLLVLTAAFVCGLTGAMLGLGAGVFIVPVLSVFFGVPIKTAIAASAVCVVVNSLGASSLYLRHALTNLRLAVLLQLPTTLGAIAGSLLVALLAPWALETVFGVALLGLAGAMLLQREPPAGEGALGEDPHGLGATYRDPLLGCEVAYVPQRLAAGSTASLGAGLMSGLLGIGGGVVQVPMMAMLMRVPLKAAAATSVFMVGITACTSASVYYVNGLIDPAVVTPALLGVAAGSQVGPRVARRLKSAALSRLLVLLLIYLAVTLLLEASGVQVPWRRR